MFFLNAKCSFSTQCVLFQGNVLFQRKFFSQRKEEFLEIPRRKQSAQRLEVLKRFKQLPRVGYKPFTILFIPLDTLLSPKLIKRPNFKWVSLR